MFIGRNIPCFVVSCSLVVLCGRNNNGATTLAASASDHPHSFFDHVESQPQQQKQAVVLTSQQARDLTTTAVPNFCAVGYVMDTFCITLGTLLDNPDVRSLQHPELHSAHCVVQVSTCVDSGYELLSAPKSSGGDYGRLVKFDTTGNDLFLAYATQVGYCTTCNGTVSEGINATVIGFLDSMSNNNATNSSSSDGTPPTLAVFQILAATVGCDNFNSSTTTNSSSSSNSSSSGGSGGVGTSVVGGVNSTSTPQTSPTSPPSATSPSKAPVSSPTGSKSTTSSASSIMMIMLHHQVGNVMMMTMMLGLFMMTSLSFVTVL